MEPNKKDSIPGWVIFLSFVTGLWPFGIAMMFMNWLGIPAELKKSFQQGAQQSRQNRYRQGQAQTPPFAQDAPIYTGQARPGAQQQAQQQAWTQGQVPPKTVKKAAKKARIKVKKKAQALADASGCTLGRPVHIEEHLGNDSYRYGGQNMERSAGAMKYEATADAAAVMPGEIEIEAEITVDYAIQ